MKCPSCASDTYVIDSRVSAEGDSVRRRRRCLKKRCDLRFTTYETEPKTENKEPLNRFVKELERFKKSLR